MTDAPRSPSSASMPRARQWTIVGVVALAALVLFVGGQWLKDALTPKPPPPPPAAPAGTFAATDQQWATLKFVQVAPERFVAADQTDGKIAVDDDVTTPVFSPYSGRVTKLFAKAGDVVRAGQPLFAVAASELVQGQSDLTTAVAQHKVAVANEARQHALFLVQGAAQRDWQQSQSDLAASEATLEAARSRLKILGQSPAQIAAMEARPGGAATAGGEAAVVSPIAGVVTQKSIGLGQIIGSVTNGGTNSAYVISNLDKVWLVGNLREADAASVKIGQPVQVRVAALPGRAFSARVDYVSPTVDPATHRLTVRATLENPGHVLKPEMFADFSVATGAGSEAIAVPQEAVILEGDTARVWVADPARKTLGLRQIKAGETAGDRVEVLSGLKPGEWVVTSGSLFIDRAAQPD
jgi:cobalt-zinc-cadmium efflux system membrane fusion protein